MSAIQKLIDAGRDPLEVLFVPLKPDVQEWVKEDKNVSLDKRLAYEIDKLDPELKARLRELIDQRVRAQYTATETDK
jgi:hypothetical protein